MPEGQLRRRRAAASRPLPASMSSEPAAKGASAPVEGGAITWEPAPGRALEVAEVPSTPLVGVGVEVGTLVGVGTGDAGTTGGGVALTVLDEVVPLLVFDFVVVVWLVDVEWAVCVEVTVVLEVGTAVAVAAATDSAVEVPESAAPTGP
jgi:hypothetical protein